MEEEEVMLRLRRQIAILLHGCNEETVNYSLEMFFFFLIFTYFEEEMLGILTLFVAE